MQTTNLEKKETKHSIAIGDKGLQFTTFDQMYRFASMMAVSHFCPKSLRNDDVEKTAANIMIAMQWGHELGMTHMAAIQNIAVVNGVPTIWGDMALALVRGSGKLEKFDESYTGDEGTDTFAAVCTSKRTGDEKEKVETFSIGDAKKANLWGKAGTWSTHPKRMLRYKARAFNLRDNFTDVIKGIHLKEEMEGVIELQSKGKNSYGVKRSPIILEKIVDKCDDIEKFKTLVDDFVIKSQNTYEFNFLVKDLMDDCREGLTDVGIEELRKYITYIGNLPNWKKKVVENDEK